MEVCGEASDGYQALQIIGDLKPDLVTVDIEMDGLSGMDMVRNMKVQHPDVPVLMLSMYDESLYAERALRAGARGYMMKQEEPDKVVQAIRIILNGDVYVSEKATSKILRLLSDSKSNEQSSTVDRLSDRELEVFKMIGENYRTRHIATKLHLSAKTVESYKARLKQKLILKDAAELARYAAEWMKSSGRV